MRGKSHVKGPREKLSMSKIGVAYSLFNHTTSLEVKNIEQTRVPQIRQKTEKPKGP